MTTLKDLVMSEIADFFATSESPSEPLNAQLAAALLSQRLDACFATIPAQPVIPEQPHRISDDDLVAVPRSVLACAGYAYGKAGLKGGFAYEELRTYFFAPTITAQHVTPERSEYISFYRDGIIAAAKWVENQRDAYDNEHGQSDPDTGAFEFGNDAQLEYSTTLSEIAEGIRSLHPASAQPVSEPYKLPELNDELIEILGRPNFTCAKLAECLRNCGQHIKRKSEHEQAAVLHVLLNLYIKHGNDWRKHAEEAFTPAVAQESE